MKDFKNRFIAGILSLAMVLTGLPGLGMTVANAAVDSSSISVTAPSEIAADADQVTVTVTGTGLQSKFYYKRSYAGTGGSLSVKDWTWQSASASGTDTEKTFVIPLPEKASRWDIKVGTDQFGDGEVFDLSVNVAGSDDPGQETVVDSTVLNTVVTDETGDPVEGIGLTLSNGQYDLNIGNTDSNGKLSYNVATNINLQGGFSLKLADGQNYELTAEPKICFGIDYSNWHTIIETVDGENYTGKVELSVSKKNAPSEPEEPVSKVNTITAKVVDETGAPVNGVVLSLFDCTYNFEYKKPATDSNGIASYQFNAYDNGTYKLSVKANQAFTSESEYSISVDEKGYITSVNGDAYGENDVLTFVVAPADGIPTIESISAPASMTKDASTVDVKIIGKNLPESFRCKLAVNWMDEFGGIATTGNFSTVQANEGGSESERTVTLDMPYSANAISWTVTVSLEDGSCKTTADIEVAQPVIADSNIEKVSADVELAERAGQTVTVTIDGTALPEELHYDIWYKNTDGEDQAVADKAVTAGGTSEQRTFTIDLPNADDYSDVKAWQIRVAIDPDDDYMPVVINVKEKSTPDADDPVKEETKANVETAIAEASEAVSSSYTEDSWKAYTDAVEAARELLNKEGVTETEITAALKAIEDAKAALVSKPAPKVAIKSVSLSSKSYIYDGKTKAPVITVKDGAGNVLKEGSDYVVNGTRKAVKPAAKYTVKVSGTGGYTGSLSVTYKITVKTTTIAGIKAGKKAFTVKAAKRASKNVTGYQLRYSSYSSMKSAKSVVIGKKPATVSKTVKNLKAKKKYYVQVRSYKTISGKKYYSAWSAKKSVTTK